MKAIIKNIEEFQEKHFFSPIRGKVDYARVILFSARLLLLNFEPSRSSIFFKLKVEKMSRLFFYKGNQFFSVSFPFTVIISEDKVLEIRTYSGRNVTNENISSAISVLNNERFKLKPSPVEFMFELSDDEPGLYLLEEIFLFEPSYIRYDIDPKNENGKLHPLIHFDINYSSYGTYKIGLEKNINDVEFENILNILTECLYLYEGARKGTA